MWLFTIRIILLVQGASGVDTDSVAVFVMEGDAVTLHTDVKANQQDRLKWYFNDTRIAQINGDQRKICTDGQCEKRFRDRLKLDHQTGSLTIINIKTTDSGLYELQFNNGIIEKIYYVSVHGVSAAERDEMKTKSVKEGESVTLHPGVMKNPNDVMTWYFNDTVIAEVTGNQSEICTDQLCEVGDERFRDGLKLDHQTGSLTITNTRTTDSGVYKLQIISSNRRRRRSVGITSVKIFSVDVTAVPHSGLSSAAVAGICLAAVVLVAAAAAVIYCSRNGSRVSHRRSGTV